MPDVHEPAEALAELLGPGIGPDFLAALVDTIVPGDEWPSAAASGGLGFLHGILTGDRKEWLPRMRDAVHAVAGASRELRLTDFASADETDRLRVLDALTDDPDYRWLATLVQHGYYADPANGGNAEGASWQMLGWTPDPPDGWPEPVRTEDLRTEDMRTGEALDRAAVIRPDQLADRYDAIVIGSGAGGGVAACVLAESGRTVLVVERGDLPTIDDLATDHLRNARTPVGFDDRTGPRPASDHPRTLEVGGTVVRLTPTDGRWGNNAMTVGGGTRVFGAQAWRFAPEDFAMASTYGIPDGSSLADWPVSYADMEPWYDRAEWEIGVSGSPAGDTSGAWRSRDYPMPPVPSTGPAKVLAQGAKRLGISTLAVPLLINSQPYNGRNACAGCAQCVGFACRVEAKNGAHNTVLARALATGRASLLTGTRVERLVTDARGRVTAASLVADVRGSVWRREVAAGEFVVSAGAIESARLLLNSASTQEPDGLGNNADQVGRHLQGHLYAGAIASFADPVNDGLGPGPAIATNDYRHHNAGIVGGGMLANEFVPTPVSTHGYLRGAGMLPLHGVEAKRLMRHLLPRTQRVVGPIQEVTTDDARIRLDPDVRDRFGIPVARLSGSPHPEDHRTQEFLADRAVEWLDASAAVDVRRMGGRGTGGRGTGGRGTGGGRPGHGGPSSGQHQAGTARMGTDPARSVTDPWGRVWGHDNVRVVDGSLHVTNGGVNPVLTIFANAMRIMDHMVG
jgi:choline dehydrogenase-like flavoprotein